MFQNVKKSTNWKREINDIYTSARVFSEKNNLINQIIFLSDDNVSSNTFILFKTKENKIIVYNLNLISLYIINFSAFNIIHIFPYSSNSILITIHPDIIKYVVLTEKEFSVVDYNISNALKSYSKSYILKKSETLLNSSKDPSFYVITSVGTIISVENNIQTQVWKAFSSGITQSFNFLPNFFSNQSNSSPTFFMNNENSISFGLLGEDPRSFDIPNIFFIDGSSFYLDSTQKVLLKLNLTTSNSNINNRNNNNNTNENNISNNNNLKINNEINNEINNIEENFQTLSSLEVFKSQTKIVGTVVLDDGGLAFATSSAIYCVSSDLIMASKSLWSDIQISSLIDIGAPDAFGVLCQNGNFGVCRASYEGTPDLFFYPNLHEEDIIAVGSGNFALCTIGKSGRIVLWRSGKVWWKMTQSLPMFKKDQILD